MLEGLFRRRRLPHWDVDDGTYFVTACLDGSIPAQGAIDLMRYREQLSTRLKPTGLSDEEWELHRSKLAFARFDEWIDVRPAVTHLAHAGTADIVRDAIYHFADIRYDLLAFVVLPSHFHWVFHPRAAWVASLTDTAIRSPRERIMQTLKGFTARRCNQLLKTHGTFWQDEAYDHVVRDGAELQRVVEYVECNPVRAGLVSRPDGWRWSSAHDRSDRTVVLGEYALR